MSYNVRRKYSHFYVEFTEGGPKGGLSKHHTIQELSQWEDRVGNLHAIIAWQYPKNWADARSCMNGMLLDNLSYEICPLTPGVATFDKEFYRYAVELMDSSGTRFTRVHDTRPKDDRVEPTPLRREGAFRFANTIESESASGHAIDDKRRRVE